MPASPPGSSRSCNCEDARLGKIALFVADRETDHPDAAGSGGIFRKAAPTASNLQQLLAGLQIDSLGKPAVFVVLRGRQIRGVILEQR